jgi:protein TonB
LLSLLNEAGRPPASADPEIGFGEELLRRVLGEPAVENKEWIACLQTNENCHLDSDLGVNPLRRYLTEGERAALDDRNLQSVPPAARPALLERAAAEAKLGESADPGMWLVSDLPEGLGVDFSRDLSCNTWGIAAIGYRPDGRPGKITVLVGDPVLTALVRDPVRPACLEAYKAMFLLSLAPAGEPTTVEKPLTMEAVLNKEVFDCASAPPDKQGGDDDSVRVRGRVRAPLLVRRVEPFYPKDARAAHVQGLSIVGAIISSSGCVRGVHLLKGSALSLDAAAMKAVSQWTYRPADLDGRTVSVYLTVTVNFRM